MLCSLSNCDNFFCFIPLLVFDVSREMSFAVDIGIGLMLRAVLANNFVEVVFFFVSLTVRKSVLKIRVR